MSNDDVHRDQDAAGRLLAGAADTVTGSRYCWLLTPATHAIASARPMGLVARALDPESWTFSFVVDGRSRKADEIRRTGEVSLLFQRETVDAFVKLSGRAAVLEDRLELSRRWKSAYDRFFPAEADRANATFVDASINRMDLWIRGVTPEPFGLQTTRLARDEDGQWRVAGDVIQACQ